MRWLEVLVFFVLQNFKGEDFLRHTAAGILYAWRMPTQNNNYSLSIARRFITTNCALIIVVSFSPTRLTRSAAI